MSGPRKSRSLGEQSVPTVSELREIARRAFSPESDWPDKDELLDVIYWIRQAFGAIAGLVWGIAGLYGVFSLGIFIALSAGLIHLYTANYQRADMDELGGSWEVAKEGFVGSMATFLVSWMISYSAIHQTF